MALHPDLERLALLGWALFPCSSRGRAALWKGANMDATHDLDTLERWQNAHPGCNWQAVAGPSGFFALDLDVPSAGGHAACGVSAFAALVAAHGPLPRQPRLRSGGGGLALFFSHRAGEAVSGRTGHPRPGIDPRRGPLAITLPPSRHLRTREPYRWLPGLAPWEVDPPPAPPWLLELLAPPPQAPLPPRADFEVQSVFAAKALDNAARKVAAAGSGSRNFTLYGQACWVGRWIGAGLLDEGYAARELIAAARAAGLEDGEIPGTVRSGFRRGRRDPVEGERHGRR